MSSGKGLRQGGPIPVLLAAAFLLRGGAGDDIQRAMVSIADGLSGDPVVSLPAFLPL